MTKPLKKRYTKNGERHLSHEHAALRKSNLKEFAFLRYAGSYLMDLIVERKEVENHNSRLSS